MSEVDRITEEGKRAIVALLNQALLAEYGMLLNYPRIIDQLANIDKVSDKQLAIDLERLGKDSFRHAGIVGQLIAQLGGKPDWDITVIDRMIDIGSMLVEQLAKEKLAMSIYQDAKRIADKNQVKAKGFLGRLTTWREEPRDTTSRSKAIDILTSLHNEEWGHIRRCENAILAFNPQPKE